MDINFHYYAVKAVARKAGFPENEAQRIASFSQYVDDFDASSRTILTNVPPWAQYLATSLPFGYWVFCPVTTGFNSWFDMAALALPSNQKWIVMPFHFIPTQPLNTIAEAANRRVVPANMGVDSLIQNMLVEARTQLLHPTDGLTRNDHLMRIGMLLHIFADTYAHQRFSGFQGWENHSNLTRVMNTINGENVTANYTPDVYYYMPSIGHTNVGHAPDDSNVEFDMRQRMNAGDGGYSVTYTRSNVDVFSDAAHEILNFLLSCRGDADIGAAGWVEFCNLLRQGFQTTHKEAPQLNPHWNAIFPGWNFGYSKDTVLQNVHMAAEIPMEGDLLLFAREQGIHPLVLAAQSNDYYRYNVFADQIRGRVAGEPYYPPHAEILTEAALKYDFTEEARDALFHNETIPSIADAPTKEMEES